ncbi:hypothetical protein [Dysgonomonas reticulitermitis]
MKKQTLIILLLFFILVAYGQEQKKYYIGGHFSYGKANYSSNRYEFTNSKEYKGKDYFTLALDYAYRASENTEFIIGLSATLVKMDFTSTYYRNNISSYTYDDTFGIFSVPIGLRYYFGKYFHANAGVSVNYHPYKGYTWGLGGFAGLGANYIFKSGVSLFLTPQIQLNMLSFGGGPSIFDEKLLQLGLNIGVGYKF